MRTIICLLIFLLTVQRGFGQDPAGKPAMRSCLPQEIWAGPGTNNAFGTQRIGFAGLPAEIEYRGVVVEALQWEDSSGTNILVLAQTGVIDVNDDQQRAEIWAGLFCKKSAEKIFTRKWKVYDYVDCFGVDMFAGFYKHSLTITDLDKDGFAEVTMLYTLVCRGGADPATKKLILYENADKYAIRGETTICDRGKQQYGGSYTPDDRLKNNKTFYDFALGRWKAFECDEFPQFHSN